MPGESRIPPVVAPFAGAPFAPNGRTVSTLEFLRVMDDREGSPPLPGGETVDLYGWEGTRKWVVPGTRSVGGRVPLFLFLFLYTGVFILVSNPQVSADAKNRGRLGRDGGKQAGLAK